MDESAYQFKPTKQFSEKFKALKSADPSGYKRISKVIERLLVNPDDADGKMHGLYNGRLKKYVGRSGYRIIYYWCELCRKENRRLKNDCDNCSKIPDHSVIFFDVYRKKDRKKML
jgi:mRNA-degrading endonuclease RelE of RelBE toxin-antitoxin system